MTVPKRVEVTDTATKLIAKLKKFHGPVMFHQSGGCCDGSAPMCYQLGDFKVGQQDVYLGDIVGAPVFIGAEQFQHWQHTQITIDAARARRWLSLESPEGMRFITRSRVFTKTELSDLDAAGAPKRGDEVNMADMV